MRSFFRLMREDIAAVLERDPAARSRLEVVLLYSGLHALWWYRIHHWLWIRGWLFLARALSQVVAFAHRDRNPSRRHHRPPLLHRSRHGRGDRRDH